MERMLKSPQPGHHVGWSATRSFFVYLGRSVSLISLTSRFFASAIIRIPSGKSGLRQGGFGGFLESLVHAIQNLADLERQTVGLVDPDDLVVTESCSKNAGQLTVAIQSLVVELHYEHVIETVHNLADTGLQGLDVPNVQPADTFTLGTRFVHRF